MTAGNAIERQCALRLAAPGGRREIPLTLRRKRNVRRMRLWVTEHRQVIVSLPWNTSAERALEFARQHSDWISQQLQECARRPGLLDYLTAQGWVSLDGVRWRVVREKHFGQSRILLDKRQRTLCLHVNARQCSELALYRELRWVAREALVRRALQLATRVGASPARITVRDQRTRWGSCSTSGTISLSWRLILVEPRIQDYVILHELAHLKQFNHSERFWKLLRSYDPRADEHSCRLRELSAQLNFRLPV